ncbi:MAG: aminotransferase class V-fold PLP-dependent enzyme [Candidatus Aminicenantes bacterium]|nr:aminotransferase class V-fold PLP-dependent enzyme [Candidatus Aminicenantes bacterium]
METPGSVRWEKLTLLEDFIRLHPGFRERFPQLERDGSGNPRIHLNCAAGTMTAVSAYDRSLAEAVLKGFQELDGNKFRCYGIVDPKQSAERDPTFALEVQGLTAEGLKKKLWAGYALQVADGNHYSAAVVRHLGRPSIGRVSFCHYHTHRDVEKFIGALKDLAA